MEQLQLSLNGLLSQIGGLCGLYLGMSCAFFVEILECLCLFFNHQIRDHCHQRFMGFMTPSTLNESIVMATAAENIPSSTDKH